MTRICAQCGRCFEPKRPHAVCCSDPCRYQHWIEEQVLAAQDGPQRVEAHPLEEVRAEQEAAKDHWSSAVREAIIYVLRHTGQFHADALADLGIPEEHRNIIGSQVARLVNQGWIVECGRRKSSIPSRNGAKSNVYRLAKAGVVGVGAGSSHVDRSPGDGHLSERVNASADSGDNAGASSGVPTPQGEGGSDLAPFRAAADPGEGSAGGDRADHLCPHGVGTDASSEPARLFDASAGMARPLNPLTDAEAA